MLAQKTNLQAEIFAICIAMAMVDCKWSIPFGGRLVNYEKGFAMYAEMNKESVQKNLIKKRNGTTQFFDESKVKKSIARAALGFEKEVSVDLILQELHRTIYDGILSKDFSKALIYAATPFIELDPAYNYVAARLFLQHIYKEVIGKVVSASSLDHLYRQAFVDGIQKAVTFELLDKKVIDRYDLAALANALYPERDNLFQYIGVQTLYERYFLKHEGAVIELPQAFWMRVAMGLAVREENPTAKAIEFYQVMSQQYFIPSTPTLFHAATIHPQLSSCYLTYVDDDLDHIFKCLKDNANMSKWSGGVANSWTQLRGTGSLIKSIKMSSQGIVPFLKLANDVVAAIYRSGSRRGATVAYLEVWHYDFEDFLDLRRNTGDERRRAHDMNTAAWIPDLFMKRVLNDQKWTLFSPDEVRDLHEIYGANFEARYEVYEQMAREGKMKTFKEVSAAQLWRKMLSRLFETGHPWATFKDACNIRSPQDHVGVVHSSNLCTEITLNTSREETAVCNIGSMNLGNHVVDGVFDWDKLAVTIKTAIRMLDSVIDINFYPTEEGKTSNLRHRPIGLGIMGLQNTLFMLNIPFQDQRALEFSDQLMEFISYHAILTSSELAKEKGAYSSFKGSKWDRGIFPIDTLGLLERERGVNIEVNRTSRMDWAPVREHVKQYGMRNSNTMAIAPTATISNISGCYPSIEPIYKNIYVKSNMSGEFTLVNEYLVNDLKRLGLWNKDMLDTIKYFDGSIQQIDAIPQYIKDKYREAFEIDPEWLVKITAVRAKWIDQSQSHNVFMLGTSGKKLHDIYMTAWRSGVKTMYYLRTLGASQVEKSTLDAKKFGYTQKREYSKIIASEAPDQAYKATEQVGAATSCSIENPECESCQ
jgi:ribonucleoside-diphosphate reductase alpha chain